MRFRGPAVALVATFAALWAAGGSAGLSNVVSPAASATRAEAAEREASRAGRLGLKPIARLRRPVYLTGAPGYPRTLFVVEQAGRIVALRRGRKHEFLDIRGLVKSSYEEGMFSLAFHPRYRRNRLLYVFYVDNGGNLRVDEFKRRRPLRAARGSRRTVLRIRHQPLTTHNADQLQFLGRFLYISTGDGGGIGDPGDDAKDRNSLLGKILRIDPRNPPGRADYRVPRSNPFVGRRGRNTIFAYGLRNPWRFSFDRVTAGRPRIVIADVGQERFEEVNIETVRNARGAFFGWDEFEGRRPYECDGACARRREPPVYTYGRSRGCTVIGGYVVRDRRLRPLRGRYVFADFCEGRLRSFRPRLDRVGRARPTGLRVSNPISFGEDRRGRLYVITYSGRVFRLVFRR